MNKGQIIQLRKKVLFYAKQGMNNTHIAQKLSVSRDFVIKWKNNKDVSQDRRGWEKGKKRKYTNEQEKKVIDKRKELENQFFLDQRQ
jgi:transposase